MMLQLQAQLDRLANPHRPIRYDSPQNDRLGPPYGKLPGWASRAVWGLSFTSPTTSNPPTT